MLSAAPMLYRALIRAADALDKFSLSMQDVAVLEEADAAIEYAERVIEESTNPVDLETERE